MARGLRLRGCRRASTKAILGPAAIARRGPAGRSRVRATVLACALLATDDRNGRWRELRRDRRLVHSTDVLCGAPTTLQPPRLFMRGAPTRKPIRGIVKHERVIGRAPATDPRAATLQVALGPHELMDVGGSGHALTPRSGRRSAGLACGMRLGRLREGSRSGPASADCQWRPAREERHAQPRPSSG